MLTISSLLIYSIGFLIAKVVESVTVTEVKFITDSGKNDYVLAGEGVTLYCLYVLKKDEIVDSVVWRKDEEKVYIYDVKTSRGSTMGILKNRILLENNSATAINIKNASLELFGKYSCHVKSDKSESQGEVVLTVIVDACKENNWEFHIDMINCEEDVTFFCRGMFPKPSPACGLYNDLTGSYVESLPFDRIEERNDGTYEISLFRRFFAKDYLMYSGHLSFRCYILVVSTSWRRGIHHKMFGESGCVEKPQPPLNGYYNLSQERTCWRTPKEGSHLTYSCNPNYELEGIRSYTCSNGTWVPLFDRLNMTNVVDLDIGLESPNCHGGGSMDKNPDLCLIFTLLTLVWSFYERTTLETSNSSWKSLLVPH